jgi:hypothetical protein
VVQTANPVYASAATRPITITFPNPVTAGDLILVGISSTQGRTYNFTVTDNKGNGQYTWYNDAFSSNYAAGWTYAIAATGGSSFTVNLTGGNAQDVIVSTYEVANFDPTIFDGSAVTVSGASANASGVKNTTASAALVLAVYGGNYGQTIVANNQSQALSYMNASTHTFGSQYVTLSAAGATTLSWGVTQPSGYLDWAETLVAIKGK